MSGERSQFQNVGVATEAVFGVVNAPDTFTYLPAFNPTPMPDQEPLEDMTMRINRGSQLRIPGSKKGSTVGFDIYATGLVTPAGPAVAATQTGLGKILQAGIGTEDLDTGTTSKDPGAGTAAIPIISDIANISTDNICGFETANNGTVWRHVEVNAAGSLTLSYALPEAPTATNDVYACANYRMIDQLVEASSVQYRCLNETSDREFDFYGCFPSSININRTAPGEIAVLSISNVVTDWTDVPATVDDTLSNPTLPTKSPWMDSQCEIWAWVDGTPQAFAAGNRRAVRGLSINYTNELMARPDPYGTNGVSMWDTGGANPLSVEVTVPPDDMWIDSFTAGDYYSAIFTFGRTAGQTFIVYIRKMHLVQSPGYPGDDGGVLADTLTFELAHDCLTPATKPPIVFAQG